MKNYFKSVVKRYKLRLVDLTPVLNKSYSALTHYMDGTRQPDIETFLILSDYLNVSLDELFETHKPVIKEDEYIILKNKDYQELKELLITALETLNKKQ